MSQQFILPDLGEGLTEAEIVNWLVAPGDTIVIDQPVVEVESAKSVVELPSPYAGVVEILHAEAGATVHAGQPLITVGDGTGGGAAGGGANGAGEAGAESAATSGRDTVPGTALRGDPAAAVDAEQNSSGAVLIGYGTKERKRSNRPVPVGRFGKKPAPGAGEVGAPNPADAVRDVPPPADPHVASLVEQEGAAPAVASTGFAATAPSRSPRVRPDAPNTAGEEPSGSGTAASPSSVVSPLVRRLARDHGFEAHSLAGSGPHGLVLRADVESHIARGPGAHDSGGAGLAASPATASGAPTTGAASGTRAGADDVRIPLTGLRKIVAERMTASRRDVPEATIWLDVDATALLEAKDQLQRSTGERWSLNALLARFVVAGLQRYPILNSSVDMAAGEIVQHSAINLGFAAQTARGLMVPVVHGAGSLTTAGLRDAVSALVETAATGNFPNDQLRGGTFTLNNYGGFGVDGSAPIINQPEVAMLGVGRIIDRPWVVDGAVVVRKVVVISMVFDHRVCDGDVPSEFIGFIARCIENPLTLLSAL